MKIQLIEHKKKMLVLLSLLLVTGFLTTSLVSYFVSLSSLRDQINTSTLPLTSDNIYSEIQRDLLRPIFISSLMSNDTFLRDWILNGEKDETQVVRYLNQIMIKYETFTSFLVSEQSQIYYHAQGVLKKVSPNEERDAWYFRVREMENDFETNVDPDLANEDAMTIFINHKVFDYDGQYIGATGVGLTIHAVISLMEDYSKKYDRNIYFADKSGKIMLCSSAFVDTSGFVQTMDGLGEYAEDILATQGMTFKYNRQGQVVHLNTRFVPELNWYLFVEQTEDQAVRQINRALIVNLILCFIITAVVLLLSIVVINTYQKVTLKQQYEIMEQHESLKHKNTELEIAILEKSTALDQNQLLMREMNHRVKNNLAMIQSLLRLQSKQVENQSARMALLDSESRMRSISNIHQMLSVTTDLSQINVVTYIQNLVKDLMNNFNIDKSKVQVDVAIKSVDFDLNILIPFSLILNELVTNSFKYAFSDQDVGILKIELKENSEDSIELIVEDNGKGMPDGYQFYNAETLGATIVTLLVDQIQGKLTCQSQEGKGTRFSLIFKMDQALTIS